MLFRHPVTATAGSHHPITVSAANNHHERSEYHPITHHPSQEREQTMYGARGRIGLITLASDTSVLPEYTRAMPEGVAVYAAPLVLPRGEVTATALAEMLIGDQL